MRRVAPLLSLLLAGCIRSWPVGSVPATPTPTPTPPLSFGVEISSPSSVSVNGPVVIQLYVWGSPASVVLRRDGTTLAELAPPYSFTWATAAEAEGVHVIDAVASSNGQVVQSASISITVDRTPPAWIGESSVSGEYCAATDDVYADFSEPLSLGSVTAGIVVTDSAGSLVPTNLTLDSGATRVSLLPDVSGLQTIGVDFTTVIQDLAGNHLAAPDHRSLVVAPFQEHSYVVDGTDLSYFSTLRFDPLGRPVVEDLANLPGKPFGVAVFRRNGSNGWSVLGDGTLYSDPSDLITSNGMSLDQAGAPVVIWSEANGATSTGIHVARWTEAGNGGWVWVGMPLAVSELGVYGASIATGSDGSIWVAYARSDGVHVYEWNGGETTGTWDPKGVVTANVDPTPGPTYDPLPQSPRIAVDGWGRAVLVWAQGYSIWVRRFDSGQWEDLGAAASTSLSSPQEPRIAVDGSRIGIAFIGTPFLASGYWSAYASEWNGSLWEELGGGPNLTWGYASVANVSVAYDDQDRLVVANDQSVPGGDNVFLSRWSGTAWEPFGCSGVATGQGAGAFHPSLALTPDGRIAVGYSGPNGSNVKEARRKY